MITCLLKINASRKIGAADQPHPLGKLGKFSPVSALAHPIFVWANLAETPRGLITKRRRAGKSVTELPLSLPEVG